LGGVPETPEDLLHHACLFHRWPSTGKLERWVFSRDGVELDLEPPVSMVASTVEPLIDMAEQDLGLIYTPTFTVRRQVSGGTLQPVLDPYLRSIGSLQILWPHNRQQLPKVKVFVDFMAKNLLAERAEEVQIEEAKLSHANLPRSEYENLESDLRGGGKRLFFEVPG
jgi:DNA-binding transcriptional LysR family regulator